jgi:hypothetical protein
VVVLAAWSMLAGVFILLLTVILAAELSYLPLHRWELATLVVFLVLVQAVVVVAPRPTRVIGLVAMVATE